MPQCEFEIRASACDALNECAKRFAIMTKPSWENRWRDTSRPRERECYEAIADVRQQFKAASMERVVLLFKIGLGGAELGHQIPQIPTPILPRRLSLARRASYRLPTPE